MAPKPVAVEQRSTRGSVSTRLFLTKTPFDDWWWQAEHGELRRQSTESFVTAEGAKAAALAMQCYATHAATVVGQLRDCGNRFCYGPLNRDGHKIFVVWLPKLRGRAKITRDCWLRTFFNTYS